MNEFDVLVVGLLILFVILWYLLYPKVLPYPSGDVENED
jgi:uncharacterized membrane protein